MRPFFSYYGAKYTGAKHYGPPRAPLVIEPFAGSACYSTRWNVPVAKLYDVSSDICVLWDWLINCSSADVAAIPDSFEAFDEVDELQPGPRTLVQFWVSKGRAKPSGKLSPWYFQYRNTRDCRVWGAAVKARIVRQKPLIERWTIDQMSYRDVPLIDAHWHVDPPYDNVAGSRYPHSDIDFAHLAHWCRSLPGEVDVCENVGATWLPFAPLYEVVSTRGRRSWRVFAGGRVAPRDNRPAGRRMKPPLIHRGATKEQQILVEQAEARGILRGIEMSIAFLEQHHHSMGAQRLREAKIVEATGDNDVGDSSTARAYRGDPPPPLAVSKATDPAG